MATQRAYSYSYNPSRKYQVNPAPAQRKNAKVEFSDKAKKRTIFAILAIGLFFVISVGSFAIASNLEYSNNKLKEANKDLTNEIQTLKVDIKENMNIGTIEAAASGKLGMVYPSGSQFVQVDGKTDVKGFAQTLKKEAFGK